MRTKRGVKFNRKRRKWVKCKCCYQVCGGYHLTLFSPISALLAWSTTYNELPL